MASLYCSAQEKIPMEFKFGMVAVGNHLLVDQTEITVGEWLGYVVSTTDKRPLRIYRRIPRLSDPDLAYLKGFRYPSKLMPDSALLSRMIWKDVLAA